MKLTNLKIGESGRVIKFNNSIAVIKRLELCLIKHRYSTQVVFDGSDSCPLFIKNSEIKYYLELKLYGISCAYTNNF